MNSSSLRELKTEVDLEFDRELKPVCPQMVGSKNPNANSVMNSLLIKIAVPAALLVGVFSNQIAVTSIKAAAETVKTKWSEDLKGRWRRQELAGVGSLFCELTSSMSNLPNSKPQNHSLALLRSCASCLYSNLSIRLTTSRKATVFGNSRRRRLPTCR